MVSKGKTAIRVIVSVIATLALVALIIFIVILGDRKREAEPSFFNNDKYLESYDEFDYSSDMTSDVEDSSSNFGSSSSNSSSSGSGSSGSGSSGSTDYGRGYLTSKTELPVCNNYDLEVNAAKVDILPTDKDYPYISYLGNEKIRFQVYERNGECNIAIESKGKILTFDDFEKKYSIAIYLPKEIAKLDVDIDAGPLDINGFKIDSLDVGVSAGDAKISNCQTKKADIDVEAGNATFYADATTTLIDANVDAGNSTILLPDDIKGFTVKYQTELGNFSDKTDFSVYSSSEGLIDRKGIITYGDKSLQISASVDVGNMTLKTY